MYRPLTRARAGEIRYSAAACWRRSSSVGTSSSLHRWSAFRFLCPGQSGKRSRSARPGHSLITATSGNMWTAISRPSIGRRPEGRLARRALRLVSPLHSSAVTSSPEKGPLSERRATGSIRFSSAAIADLCCPGAPKSLREGALNRRRAVAAWSMRRCPRSSGRCGARMKSVSKRGSEERGSSLGWSGVKAGIPASK